MPTPKIIFSGNHLDLIRHGPWESVRRKNLSGIVGIVPVTDDGKLILVEQYRPPLERNVIELPAGLVGDIPGKKNEEFVNAAQRELEEETGYRAEKFEYLFTGVTSAGISNEQISFYLATGLCRVGPGGGDDSEKIKVYDVPTKILSHWLREKEKKGSMVDIKIHCILSAVLMRDFSDG